MASDISTTLRQTVRNRADNRCEYCLIIEDGQLYKHEIDHILPRQHDGKSVADNLALACWRCNRHKGTNVGAYDLEMGHLTPLFNPRTQVWTEHFRLEVNGTIVPLTAEARVTIRILNLNGENQIEERRELIEAGLF